MKLKQALKIAKDHRYDFIAADGDGSIYMYHSSPTIGDGGARWMPVVGESTKLISRVVYTGSKGWMDTLRAVKWN